MKLTRSVFLPFIFCLCFICFSCSNLLVNTKTNVSISLNADSIQQAVNKTVGSRSSGESVPEIKMVTTLSGEGYSKSQEVIIDENTKEKTLNFTDVPMNKELTGSVTVFVKSSEFGNKTITFLQGTNTLKTSLDNNILSIVLKPTEVDWATCSELTKFLPTPSFGNPWFTVTETESSAVSFIFHSTTPEDYKTNYADTLKNNGWIELDTGSVSMFIKNVNGEEYCVTLTSEEDVSMFFLTIISSDATKVDWASSSIFTNVLPTPAFGNPTQVDTSTSSSASFAFLTTTPEDYKSSYSTALISEGWKLNEEYGISNYSKTIDGITYSLNLQIISESSIFVITINLTPTTPTDPITPTKPTTVDWDSHSEIANILPKPTFGNPTFITDQTTIFTISFETSSPDVYYNTYKQALKNADWIVDTINEQDNLKTSIYSKNYYEVTLSSDINNTFQIVLRLPINPTITYMPNGGTGTLPSQQTKIPGTTLTLAYNNGNLTKSGYTFKGWNTDLNGTGTHYAEGAEYKDATSVTLYAEWEATPYTITYNVDMNNWVNGYSAPSSYNIEQSITLPIATNLTKDGYTFAGWFTTDTFTDTAVTTIPTGSTGIKTFYAKWEQNTALSVTILKSIGITCIESGNTWYFTCEFNSTNSVNIDPPENVIYVWKFNGKIIETATTNKLTISLDGSDPCPVLGENTIFVSAQIGENVYSTSYTQELGLPTSN